MLQIEKDKNEILKEYPDARDIVWEEENFHGIMMGEFKGGNFLHEEDDYPLGSKPNAWADAVKFIHIHPNIYKGKL